MSKCRYDLTTDCNNKDCVKCVLDKISAEIEQQARPYEIGGRATGKGIRYGLCKALDIIDRYRGKRE